MKTVVAHFCISDIIKHHLDTMLSSEELYIKLSALSLKLLMFIACLADGMNSIADLQERA